MGDILDEAYRNTLERWDVSELPFDTDDDKVRVVGIGLGLACLFEDEIAERDWLRKSRDGGDSLIGIMITNRPFALAIVNDFLDDARNLR